jgi:hypothetical protein
VVLPWVASRMKNYTNLPRAIFVGLYFPFHEDGEIEGAMSAYFENMRVDYFDRQKYFLWGKMQISRVDTTIGDCSLFQFRMNLKDIY